MSGTFINPLSRSSPGVVGRAREIKAWTREAFLLSDNAVVSVNELSCHVPGCPPKETVVLMMHEEQTVQISIHKAMHDVTKQDIQLAHRAQPSGGL